MSNRPPGCKAYERGDQWFCDACQLVWDIGDDDPPGCKTVEVTSIDWGSDKCRTLEVGMNALEYIRRNYLNEER